jgi:hypothetical protein
VRNFIFFDFEQVDAFEPERGGPLAELVEESVFVAPAADGLVDAAFARSLRHGGRIRRECGCDGSGGGGLEEGAAGRHGNRVQGTGYRVQGAGNREQGIGNRE